MTLETDIHNRIEALAARFTQIGHERLQGLPIYNDHLHVEAVDFQACHAGLLGALVTPWFINIMLLPHEAHKWQLDEVGSKHRLELDSGEYEFVLGEDEVIGRYFFRSVVSPPHCYRQQAAARLEAAAALQKLLGENEQNAPEENVSHRAQLDPKQAEPQGRREFIRNLFAGSVKNTF